MKNKLFSTFLIFTLTTVFLLHSYQTSTGADKTYFAIIFLGGPDPGTEGKKIISQFLTSLSKSTGMSSGALQGEYFNDIGKAKNYLKKNNNSFIMGSIGFFLANRKSMNLVPLTIVKLQGNDKEQFYMLIQKGRYKSLKQLKGKILAGNVLYEEKKFISKIIFNNIIDVSSYFKLKPTQRPLSAVRRVARGKYDAVLLNHMQFQSLKNLSVFNELEVVHKSPKMPALGLMMINTGKNILVKDKIVNAITRMCSMKEGKSVCKNFGIDGFIKIEPESINNEIKRYDSAE